MLDSKEELSTRSIFRLHNMMLFAVLVVVFLFVDCVVVVVITVVFIVCQKSIDLLKESLRYCLCRCVIVVACCRCCLHQIVPSSFNYLTYAMDLDLPTSELLLLLLVSSLTSPVLLPYSIANRRGEVVLSSSSALSFRPSVRPSVCLAWA